MKFHGYWVTTEHGKINVAAGEFDETELSDKSDWQEAWQNEEPDHPHGYLDCLAMLHDVSRRIVGDIDKSELDVARAKFRDGTLCSVDTLEELARLIQLAIPKQLPRQTSGANATPVDG